MPSVLSPADWEGLRNPRPRTLTQRHELFLAALRADPRMTPATAYCLVYGVNRQRGRGGAAALMKLPLVREEVKAIREQHKQRVKLEAETIVEELASVTTADAREFTEYRIGACRYCHGAGHDYQRTPREFREAWEQYAKDQALLPEDKRDTLGLKFDHRGGVGYNANRDPHPDCPECHGDGVGRAIVKDTRRVSRKASRLYAGVKQTKDGIEVKMRNPDKALELSMRHLGMLEDVGRAKSPEEHAQAVRELVEALTATTPAPEAP